MDFDLLVDEIVSRVSAKIEQAEQARATSIVRDDKPRLLILTQQHGDICHRMLESARLLEYYHTECALLKEYDCDPAAYEAVIIFNLTNDALCKLACGMCDTPFTALAQKLILSGKKAFIPQEEIELFQYQQTAPAAYYAMMAEKLALLQASGVTVCPAAGLEDAILNGETACIACTCAAETETAAAPEPIAAPQDKLVPETAPETGAEVEITKKVISEKDMIAACVRGVTRVRIRADAIVTDLAREYVEPRNVVLVRA